MFKTDLNLDSALGTHFILPGPELHQLQRQTIITRRLLVRITHQSPSPDNETNIIMARLSKQLDLSVKSLQSHWTIVSSQQPIIFSN